MQVVRFLLLCSGSRIGPSAGRFMAHLGHQEKQQPRLLQYQEIGTSPIGRFQAQWFRLKAWGLEPVKEFPPSMRGLSPQKIAEFKLSNHHFEPHAPGSRNGI
jgi:hypothetical protein